ncbi:MAG: DUF45 domain-containing protein, partial [Clostridia bacterium]|nr:DUF45 domain-containing protein [Clostridia bacterium]
MIEYNYDVIRSRRRSFSVSVSAENKITVRCPLNFPEYKIEEFLLSKKSWLDKIVSKNSAKLLDDEGIINYREVYVGGKKLPLVFTSKNAVTPE